MGESRDTNPLKHVHQGIASIPAERFVAAISGEYDSDMLTAHLSHIEGGYSGSVSKWLVKMPRERWKESRPAGVTTNSLMVSSVMLGKPAGMQALVEQVIIKSDGECLDRLGDSRPSLRRPRKSLRLLTGMRLEVVH